MCMNCKGMEAAGEFICERFIDQSMPPDACNTGETGRHDHEPEVAFSGAGRRPMPSVQLALVDHIEAGRLKGDHQFGTNFLFERHRIFLLLVCFEY